MANQPVDQSFIPTMDPPKAVLYAIGGTGKNTILKSVSRYDPETGSWNALPMEIPFKRSEFGCVSVGKRIYVFGGSNGSRPIETIFKLHTEEGEWSELQSMKFPREGCSAVCSADGKYIYLAGGWSHFESCSAVKRFSLNTHKWTTVQPMGATKDIQQLIELSGFIYALGLSGAERYNSETDEWSPIPPMKHEHIHGFHAAVLNGKIYVLGETGFEMYSPEENRWTELPVPTFLARSRKLVALNGELLAVGGMKWEGPKKNEETAVYINAVESFDVEKQIWSRKPDMDVGRADHGLVVVNPDENDDSDSKCCY